MGRYNFNAEYLVYLQDTMVYYFIVIFINLGSGAFVILKSQRLKLCRGHLFSRAVKMMLFISDAQHCVPIKLCRMAENINLFQIMEMLTPENIKLKRHFIWDVIELKWKKVNVTLNGNKIYLPKSFTIKFRDKFKTRCNFKRETLLFHIMSKQGSTWFTLASNNPPETV